jgi:hypothetical protein
MHKEIKMSAIDQEFYNLTKDFNLEDWRTVRTEEYWWVTNVSGIKRSRSTYEKLDFIKDYINKDIPKCK